MRIVLRRLFSQLSAAVRCCLMSEPRPFSHTILYGHPGLIPHAQGRQYRRYHNYHLIPSKYIHTYAPYLRHDHVSNHQIATAWHLQRREAHRHHHMARATSEGVPMPCCFFFALQAVAVAAAATTAATQRTSTPPADICISKLCRSPWRRRSLLLGSPSATRVCDPYELQITCRCRKQDAGCKMLVGGRGGSA
jgi:hypothetical protein